MKVKDLIGILETIPDDTDVCVLDETNTDMGSPLAVTHCPTGYQGGNPFMFLCMMHPSHIDSIVQGEKIVWEA